MPSVPRNVAIANFEWDRRSRPGVPSLHRRRWLGGETLSPSRRLANLTKENDPTKDRRRELRERMALKAQATPWIPTQEGDELAGTVAARGQGSTRLGDVRDIIYVRQDEGAIMALWLMGSVLETEIGRKNVSVGDYIVVVFAGKKTSS